MKTIAILVTFLFLAVCVQGAVWFNTATTNAAPTVLGPNVLSSVSNSAYSGWATNVINKPVVIAGTNGIQVITNGLGYTVSFTNSTVGGGNAFVTQNPLTNDISGSVYGNISQATNWIDREAYKGFGQLAADSFHQNMNFFHGAIVAVGGLAGRPFWSASFSYTEYEDFADFPEALQGWLEEVPTYDLTTRLTKMRDYNPTGNISIGFDTFANPITTNTLQLWNLYYTKFLYEIWVKTHDKTLFSTYGQRATNALNLMPTSGGLIYWASNYLVTFKDMDNLTNSRGYDLIGSVFLYDDYRMLAEIAHDAGSNTLATAYSNNMATISAGLVTQLWDAPAGLYKGFSVSNRQHSLWGNAYAVACGAAPTTQKTLICSNFLAQWGTTNYWLHGALRVLPAGETWDADGTGGGFQRTTYGPWVADLTFEVLWQSGRPDYAYQLANDYMKEAVRRASGETLEAWNSETDALDPQFADYMIAASGRPLGWIQKHLPADTSGISYVPMPGSPAVISEPLNSTQDYLWGYKGPWPDPFGVGFLKWSINSNGFFSGTAAWATRATNADWATRATNADWSTFATNATLASYVSGILTNGISTPLSVRAGGEVNSTNNMFSGAWVSSTNGFESFGATVTANTEPVYEGGIEINRNATNASVSFPFAVYGWSQSNYSKLLYVYSPYGANNTVNLVVGDINPYRGTLWVMSDTNVFVFGNTNTTPIDATTPVKWISVRVYGEGTNEYRMPLYK